MLIDIAHPAAKRTVEEHTFAFDANMHQWAFHTFNNLMQISVNGTHWVKLIH